MLHDLGARMYVRIHLALLGSLVLAAVLFGVVHVFFNPADTAAGADVVANLALDRLPPASATRRELHEALRAARMRAHVDLALYDPEGRLVAAAGRPLPLLNPAQADSGTMVGSPSVYALHLPDGRWLLARRAMPHRFPMAILVLLVMVAILVGIGAYPVVRRITRRLERLKDSVVALGAGDLSTRVAVEGKDEVALLASAFNESAARIEALVTAQKSLLANASHELRSPLARLRMAVELVQDQAAPAIRAELTQNIAELDQLIEELLLASRLDATASDALPDAEVDLAGIVAEECARVDAQFDAVPLTLQGDARLLRRMIRNLLENGQRYGDGSPVTACLASVAGAAQLDICDRGPGVPEPERDRIFAPFYRLPGASESAGGVGLGLALVRQIARRHGGDVVCLPNPLGGSCFRVTLPVQHRAG